MNKFFYLFICIVIASLYFNCAGLKPKPYAASHIPTIRVLILEESEFQLNLLGSYVLSDYDQTRLNLPSQRYLLFKISDDYTEINVFQNGIDLFSGSGFSFLRQEPGAQFKIKTKQYQGDIHFVVGNKQIQVINSIDLESYLKGVVPIEIGKLGKTEIEALKAQAVASRTFALQKLRQKGKNETKYNYDVSAGVSDQVYVGKTIGHKWSDLAIDETSGEVVVFQNSLISAFFHSTCGGRTEHGKNVFTGGDKPYLHGVADNFGQGDFCENSPHHRWVESFTIDDIKHALQTNYNGYSHRMNNQSITNVVVKKRFESGRIKELSLFFGSKYDSLMLKGDHLRRIIRTKNGELLRSNLFKTVRIGSPDNPNGFKLMGAGNGHGVGMCQWGAIGMAKQGFHYQQILSHYYRGSTLKKLY